MLKVAMLALVGAALLSAAWAACAGDEGSDEAAASALSPAWSSLAWLSGTWRTEGKADFWEETWSGAAGNSMVASTRWVKNGRTRLFELSSLEVDEHGLALRILHFNPKLAAWSSEAKGPPCWRLKSVGTSELVFEDPAKSFPRRVVYARVGAEGLTVRLEGEEAGKARVMAFAFKRVRAASANSGAPR